MTRFLWEVICKNCSWWDWCIVASMAWKIAKQQKCYLYFHLYMLTEILKSLINSLATQGINWCITFLFEYQLKWSIEIYRWTLKGIYFHSICTVLIFNIILTLVCPLLRYWEIVKQKTICQLDLVINVTITNTSKTSSTDIAITNFQRIFRQSRICWYWGSFGKWNTCNKSIAQFLVLSWIVRIEMKSLKIMMKSCKHILIFCVYTKANAIL